MMKELLWLIVALPFAGSLVLAVAGKRMPRLASAIVGVGSVIMSAALALAIGIEFLLFNGSGYVYEQTLWEWINVSGLSCNITFHLDAVSLVFVFVITFVGALIHIYSSEFMWKEPEGYSRFFVFMNLFMGFMLVLVLANNFLLMYLGWEGVGLCSFLLIGFWYKDPANGYAARKAFIVTRIGDTSFAIGLFLLFSSFHTLNINEILIAAPADWVPGSAVAVWAAFLLLGGAIGKSAQLPLQTWLPDAMAAPSPVSALIHAATMVTAGVYLIARTHTLFELAPIVLSVVAVVGVITLLTAGLSALNQHDIKKILAYSTISQIGYMFLALGVGAWSAALFHFMIHAFFKALLFLGAGSIISVLAEEHNIFKMGGLRQKLPLVFWTFLTGSTALAALPLLTAGFYSKDEIIWAAFASDRGSWWLWFGALAGAFITALYTFRMVFVAFFGDLKMTPDRKPGMPMTVPLIILGFLTIAGGFIQWPETMGHLTLFADVFKNTLPLTAIRNFKTSTEWMLQIVSSLTAIAGVMVAYKYYFDKKFAPAEPKRNSFQMLMFKGWDFDLIYNTVIVAPVVYLSQIDKRDIIDSFYTRLAALIQFFHSALSYTQTGKVRVYAIVLAIGVAIMLTIIFYP